MSPLNQPLRMLSPPIRSWPVLVTSGPGAGIAADLGARRRRSSRVVPFQVIADVRPGPERQAAGRRRARTSALVNDVAGRDAGASVLANSAYASEPVRSLKITERQLPSAVGLTHASSVIPLAQIERRAVGDR